VARVNGFDKMTVEIQTMVAEKIFELQMIDCQEFFQ
jgi:hypothetical protein